MNERVDSARATREAAQPSLWDRLKNVMPEICAELERGRSVLSAEFGLDRLDALLTAGTRAIDAEITLTNEDKKRLHRLVALEHRRAELNVCGVIVSADDLKEAVRRDIEALFNTERFESRPLLTDREAASIGDDPPNLAAYPEVRRSTINYGVPPFAGRSPRDFDRPALAREIRAILATFEPRLKEGATRVTVTAGSKTAGLTIEIDGLLLMSPAPERLRLKTMIDLDSGRAKTELWER